MIGKGLGGNWHTEALSVSVLGLSGDQTAGLEVAGTSSSGRDRSRHGRAVGQGSVVICPGVTLHG